MDFTQHDEWGLPPPPPSLPPPHACHVVAALEREVRAARRAGYLHVVFGAAAEAVV